MRLIITIFYLLLILLGISFAVLNSSSVQVNFYYTTLTMPISVLIVLSLGVGLLIGGVFFAWRYWRVKIDYRRIQNQLKLTETEIKNLRSIPLQDQH